MKPGRTEMEEWRFTPGFLKEAGSRLGLSGSYPGFLPENGILIIEQACPFIQAIERITAASSNFPAAGILALEGVFPQGKSSNHGENWKTFSCLSDSRPDLILIAVDVEPAGVLLILNAGSNEYSCFSPALSLFRKVVGKRVPDKLFQRFGSVTPEIVFQSGLFEILGKARSGDADSLKQAYSLARSLDRRESIAVHFSPLESIRRLDPAFSFAGISGSTPPDWRTGTLITNSVLAMIGPPPASGNQRHYFGRWENENADEREPFCYELTDCRVGGGRMRLREKGQHIFGQIVVANNGEVHEASFACKSGIYSIPANIRQHEGEWSFVPPFDNLVELKGDYYLLGNVPPHFGHGLLEGFSRWWALAQDPGRFCNFKFLLFEQELPEYARLAFEKLGVEKDRIIHCPRNGIVERLIVPTRTYRTHNWALKAQSNIWSRLGESIAAGTDKLVFLSRKHIGIRKLRNESAVEQLAAARGFRIVSPETMPLEEQIRMVRGADIVMGCVGSAGYLCVFSTNKNQVRLILSPRDFLYPEDCLTASIAGGRIVYVLGQDVGSGRRSSEGNWTIDLNDVQTGIDFAFSRLGS